MAEFGVMPLDEFRRVFGLEDPTSVTDRIRQWETDEVVVFRPARRSTLKPHLFQPGFTGMSCDQLFADTEGCGDVCGLPADHPVHDVPPPEARDLCEPPKHPDGCCPGCIFCDPQKWRQLPT